MRVRRKPTNKGQLFNISALYDRHFLRNTVRFHIVKGYHLVPFPLNFFQMQKKKERIIHTCILRKKARREKSTCTCTGNYVCEKLTSLLVTSMIRCTRH